MRITNRTLKRLIILTGLVLLCGGLTASSCVKDRLIDVVASGDVVASFTAHGSDNTWDDSQEIDLASEVSSALNDNEFEEGSVRATLESVSYRVTEKDPTTDRTITGTISVARQGQSPAELVRLTSVLVDDPANETWVPVPLTQAGTDLINAALDAVIANPGTPLILTFSTQGTSTPADVSTHFTWEARVTMNIVGKKKITVFQPI